ncbi:MAG: hypothetical protein ACXADU_20755, partial [Promethearchaeota archaeon]
MLSLSLNFVQTYAVDVPEDIGMSNVYYILPNPDSDLFFVSISNDNAIEIYSLDDGDIRLETDFTLHSLIPYRYQPEGNYLKVLSEEPIMIYILGTGTYFPAESGKFVGKNFIVFPFSWEDDAFWTGNFTLEIWALGDGMVTIMNETHVIPLLVFEGTFSKLILQISELHKYYFNISSEVDLILSTENGISAAGEATVGIPILTAPSTTGQLVGKVHYGLGRFFMAPRRGCFQVIAYEPGVVTVTNLEDPSQVVQHTFTEPGEVWHEADYDYIPLKIEGDIDTFVQVGFGEDRIVSGNQPYIGGRATDDDKIEYWFYSGVITIDDENLGGVIFAPEDVTFILDDEEISLSVDEYKKLAPTEKLHYLVSSEPVVIYNGFLNGFALAPSGIPATKPEIKEEPDDNTMIYAGVAVAAIVVVAAL